MFALFEKLLNPFAQNTNETKINKTISFLFSQIHDLRIYIMLVMIFSAGMALSEVYLFNLLGKIVDLLVSVDESQKEDLLIDNKWIFIQACMVLFLCLPFVVVMHSVILNQTLSGVVQVRIINQINKLLLKQKLPYFADTQSGKLAATILQLSGATRYVLLKSIDIVVYIFVFLISASLFIVKNNWILLTPVVLWILGYVYAMSVYIPKLKKSSAEQADNRSNVSANLVDIYTNISTVKLYQGEDNEVAFCKKNISKYLSATFLQMRVISQIAFANWGLNVALIFFSSALCIYYWSSSLVSVGVVSGVIALILRLYTVSHWIIWEVSGLSEQLGIIKNALSSINPLGEATPEKDTKSSSLIKDSSISFNSVFFGFQKSKLIFNSLSFDIKNKEKIGIVGESGSGKSTLIKLLMGFRSVDAGDIRIGGTDIESLSYGDLMSNISVVTQDVELLNRSIYDNISYGAKDATIEQVLVASKIACAHDFIESLEDQEGNKSYAYIVGEKGGRLSGGQKQRIALARAILKNAPILILDEATSAVDSITEAAIVNNLQDYIKDKTLIFITHRMSSIHLMNRIMVMQAGQLIELGSHEYLMDLNGIYKLLWDSQVGYLVDSNVNEKIADPVF